MGTQGNWKMYSMVSHIPHTLLVYNNNVYYDVTIFITYPYQCRKQEEILYCII